MATTYMTANKSLADTRIYFTDIPMPLFFKHYSLLEVMHLLIRFKNTKYSKILITFL